MKEIRIELVSMCCSVKTGGGCGLCVGAAAIIGEYLGSPFVWWEPKVRFYWNKEIWQKNCFFLVP